MCDTVVMYLELCLVLCLTPHCMYSSMKSFTHTREREGEGEGERRVLAAFMHLREAFLRIRVFFL